MLAMHRDINESHIADKLITVGNSTESVGMFDSGFRHSVDRDGGLRGKRGGCDLDLCPFPFFLAELQTARPAPAPLPGSLIVCSVCSMQRTENEQPLSLPLFLHPLHPAAAETCRTTRWHEAPARNMTGRGGRHDIGQGGTERGCEISDL